MRKKKSESENMIETKPIIKEKDPKDAAVEELIKRGYNAYLDRGVVLCEAINEDTFKIRAAKSLLSELYKELPDKNKVKSIIDMTDGFPSVANSVDAFIVKNIDSTSQEIAEALVSPASISIEHIRPQTLGGESKGGNYIAASRRMNNYRGSMSYPEFVEKFKENINDIKVDEYKQESLK